MKTLKKIFSFAIISFLIIGNSYSKPVELGSFTASVNNNNVTLNWQTNTEANDSGFLVQRKRVEVTDWSDLGFVAGNGTTTIPHDYSYNDLNLQLGSYNYRLKQLDFNGNFQYHVLGSEVVITTIGIGNNNEILVDNFRLEQNYPNPFNPVTIINYQLPMFNFVSLKVYDVLGNEVAILVNQKQSAGSYSVEFDGANFSSGKYFYKITVGEFSDVKRMILVK
jgi:Secretion system C-terminal sorting domain